MHIVFQGSRHAKEICSEYAKFFGYSVKWYQKVTQKPDIPPSQLQPDLDDVARGLSEIAGDVRKEGCNVELDLTLQDIDMERYQAAHVKLAREICQDEETRKLWYTIDYDPDH